MRVLSESLLIFIEESDEALRLSHTRWLDASAVPALHEAVASTKA